MEVGSRSRMMIVGPATNTNTARTSASTMLMLDSHWMPFATPETAESDERNGQHRDDGDQQPGADLVHPAQLLDAAADLEGAEPERGRGAEEGGEDREDVDDPAGRAVRVLLADQRGEDGADRSGGCRRGRCCTRWRGPRRRRSPTGAASSGTAWWPWRSPCASPASCGVGARRRAWRSAPAARSRRRTSGRCPCPR